MLFIFIYLINILYFTLFSNSWENFEIDLALKIVLSWFEWNCAIVIRLALYILYVTTKNSLYEAIFDNEKYKIYNVYKLQYF